MIDDWRSCGTEGRDHDTDDDSAGKVKGNFPPTFRNLVVSSSAAFFVRLASGVTFIIRFLRFGLIFSSSSPFVHKIQAQTHAPQLLPFFFLYFIRRFTNETLPHNTAERYRPTASGTLPHQYQSSFGSTQLNSTQNLAPRLESCNYLLLLLLLLITTFCQYTHSGFSIPLLHHLVQFLQRRRTRRVFCIIFLLITVLS